MKNDRKFFSCKNKTYTSTVLLFERKDDSRIFSNFCVVFPPKNCLNLFRNFLSFRSFLLSGSHIFFFIFPKCEFRYDILITHTHTRTYIISIWIFRKCASKCYISGEHVIGAIDSFNLNIEYYMACI